jgi:hypothetical protein
MKTLVRNNVSLMILADDVPVVIGEKVEVGSPVKLIIGNSDYTLKLYENVAPPTDYQEKRYCFDGETWSYNFNWRDKKLTAAKR